MLLAIVGIIGFYSCNKNKSISPSIDGFEEKIVVANRNSSSISFIDVESDEITETLDLPGAEPMYVLYAPKTDRIYVGDRAKNKVYIINPDDHQIESSIDVGKGVFHMSADRDGKELWVINDIDNSISVVNLESKSVTNTIQIDAKPHDIFTSHDGATAYVSILTDDVSADKIYKYTTSSYTKNSEVAVGKQPHLYHHPSNYLYVACESGQLFKIHGNTLAINSEKEYAGAHGITGSLAKNVIFVSNILDKSIFSINPETSDPFQVPFETPERTPHNLVLNADENRLYVTHSGESANTVSVYRVYDNNKIKYCNPIKVGDNPFGLASYKRMTK